MSRQKANLELLNLMGELMVKYPDLRFSQILLSFGFVEQQTQTVNHGRGVESVELSWMDEFYTEPETVLQRVRNELQRQASST